MIVVKIYNNDAATHVVINRNVHNKNNKDIANSTVTKWENYYLENSYIVGVRLKKLINEKLNISQIIIGTYSIDNE